MKPFFAVLFFVTGLWSNGQNIPVHKLKFIFFPYTMTHKWQVSIGLTATTMPYEITEELHYQIPAGDFHVLRKVNDKIYLDGRVSFQLFQNLVSIGPRWSTRFSDQVSFSVGDDIGYWFGALSIEGFKTRGHGWQNDPNLSFGFRFNKRVLLTLKADGIMVLDIKTYAGNIPVTTNYRLLSGSSYTILLEQPFYGKKYLSLGLRAVYTNFYWQTWAAFTSFDRNLFYPQLIIGLIL